MQTKVIPGFSNYTISEDGVVTNIKTGYIISTSISRGYKTVSIKNDTTNKSYCTGIHRLLMITFKPVEGMDKLVVDHIDCNKTNNSLDNLEWVTSKENTHRAIKNGCYKNGRQVITDEVAIAIRKEYIPGKNGNFRQLLEKYQLKKSMFYYIINNQFRKDLVNTEEVNTLIDKIDKNKILDYKQEAELKELISKRNNGELKCTKTSIAKQFNISVTTFRNYEKRLFPSV